MRELWTSLLDVLFPPACVACDEPAGHDAVALGERAAPAGALGEQAAPGPSALERAFCATCRASVEPAPLAPGDAAPRDLPEVLAPYLYGGQLAVAVRRFKYAGQLELAGPLGALLAEALLSGPAPQPWRSATALVPVPLHRRRLRERGYNQAALLARALARALGRPWRGGWIERRLDLPPQARLDLPARQKVAAAVAVPRRARPALVGQRLLVVDDVVTTGATSAAVASALREAGAVVVGRVALARAP